ncbi:MAG: 3-hydroxyacyl-CoA dehydrogenase family protein [Rikenellaceae bacterium]|nr:3-hydroxyacyl-CoA dehydrogenase family protein [Rikenellaceae bacterium]
MKQKVVIVGAGLMGSGIALDLASHGFSVILKDISATALVESQNNIKILFRTVKLIKRNYTVSHIDEILERIEFTCEFRELTDVDLVIENITEDWDMKKDLYAELNKIFPEDTVIASNTSCISITRLSSLVANPGRIIGSHFMNPVPLKSMVEIIKGFHTSISTMDKIIDLLKTIQKAPVIVNDYPGFVANRLSHLFMNEAAFLIQDGVANPIEIDTIFKKGYGHAMGPLETADLIGLDTVVNSLGILYKEYQDTKFRCCPLLKKMVAAGLLGKKSGEGFYKY